MKRFLLVSLGILYVQFLFAQIPDGYYDSANGLSGIDLKAALHNIIDGHTVKTYDDLWNILKESDEDPNNTENFILIYTGRSIPKTSVYPAFNREHVWAKSHGFPDESDYGYTDAHHLRPSDVDVNSARGNLDFDNGGNLVSGTTDCYSDEDSWEPRDEVKGDIARMMFYMVVRYEGDGGTSDDYDLELVDYVGTSGVNFGKLSTLLEWHKNDPVDNIDRHRNEVVFSYQHNRNPFIDHPEYVARIWGGNALPAITHIEIDPINPTFVDEVTVTATIYDSDGSISSAEIKWGTTSGNYNNSVTMNYSGSDDIYSGIIPAQEKGETVYYVIEATDNESEVIQSVESFYTVAQNVLPNITGITNSPSTPTEGDDVTITAAISDSDGTISLAELKWGVAKGTYDNTVTMVYTGADNIYTGIIPSQVGGTVVNYVIEAKDNDAESNRSDEYSFSFNTVGNEIPEITNINFEPITPESNEPVSISATITDADGTISSASVKWGTENGLYPNIVTMNNNVDIYNADIPAQINETHVYFIVYAIDEDGGATQSEEFSYIVEDIVNQVPIISNVLISPESPTENDNVSISVNVSDEDGNIELVNFIWKKGEGEYSDDVNMNFSGGAYYGLILKQAAGETIYFKITAEDNEGLTSNYEGSYEISQSNSINKDEIVNLKLYPNPTNGILNIEFSKSENLNSISIYNLIGEMLLEISDLNKPSCTVNLSSFPKGIYIIKISDTEKSISRKIMLR